MKLKIERLTYGGDGLARQDGLVWFVPGSAPGDLVEVEETERKKSYRRGRIGQLLEPSPFRVAPPCPWFGPLRRLSVAAHRLRSAAGCQGCDSWRIRTPGAYGDGGRRPGAGFTP